MKISLTILILVVTVVLAKVPSKYSDEDGMHPSGYRYLGPKIIRDWHQLGQDELKMAMELERTRNTNRARNVILFLGDGLGLPTIAAARKLKTQLQDDLELTEAVLEFDKFPHIGLSRTYNVDRYVPDSAATGTAFLCGHKAPYSTLGVGQHAIYDNCTSVKGNEVYSFLKLGMDEGKWAGVITNTRITHATPAASYAHVTNRDWEAAVPTDVENWAQCMDNADQLVNGEENMDMRVILGGGRRSFLSTIHTDPETGEPGKREDDRDLMEEWIKRRQDGDDEHQLVMNKDEFDNADPKDLDYLMGLFSYDHMDFEWDRANKTIPDQPSLSEMVKKAIDLLEKNDDGFVLLVEGGRIDQAHHDSNAFIALYDTLEFDNAVKVALEYTLEEDTLIVVTADHSHVFNMGGYPTMDNDLFGLDNSWWPAGDNKPYTTLTYSNGPGFWYHRMVDDEFVNEIPRINLMDTDTKSNTFVQDSGIPLDYETHGGEDVGIFAKGPMAHLFHGVHDQTYIAHVMMYAACLGENKDHCGQPPAEEGTMIVGSPLMVALMCLCTLLWRYRL